jgi:zinc transport system substrate-binding protein
MTTTRLISRCLALAASSLGLAASAVADDLDVVTTIKPVHALVAEVMAGAGAPHLLLDGGASPHTYALKPSEVRRLGKANVIVRVSDRLETFLERPLKQVPKSVRIVSMDESTGMTFHKLRAGAGFEAHDHGHDHGHKHGHSHPRSAKQKSTAAGRPSDLDAHLWLDPMNARAFVLHLGSVLATADPDRATLYRTNAEAAATRLTELDRTLAAKLTPLAGRPFLVFHDAYQYAERRYGLTGAGSVTVNPEVPPSAKRLSAIRARLSKDGIVCVFAEPQFPPRAIDSILEGSTVRRAALDPLGAAIPEGPGHYTILMQQLAGALTACLAK